MIRFSNLIAALATIISFTSVAHALCYVRQTGEKGARDSRIDISWPYYVGVADKYHCDKKNEKYECFKDSAFFKKEMPENSLVVADGKYSFLGEECKERKIKPRTEELWCNAKSIAGPKESTDLKFDDRTGIYQANIWGYSIKIQKAAKTTEDSTEIDNYAVTFDNGRGQRYASTHPIYRDTKTDRYFSSFVTSHGPVVVNCKKMSDVAHEQNAASPVADKQMPIAAPPPVEPATEGPSIKR